TRGVSSDANICTNPVTSVTYAPATTPPTTRYTPARTVAALRRGATTLPHAPRGRAPDARTCRSSSRTMTPSLAGPPGPHIPRTGDAPAALRPSGGELLAAHAVDRRHDLVGELAARLRGLGARRDLPLRVDGLAEVHLDAVQARQALADRLDLVRAAHRDGHDGRVPGEREPRDARAPLVELAVARARALGVDAERTAAPQHLERVLERALPRARVVALHGDHADRREEPARQ